MSLFRKPKKIQRRVFAAEEDDDEPEAPPPPMISRPKKENKPIKTTPMLSFADEEEEGEVFKVKKSSQSKKLSKKKNREKKKDVQEDNSNDPVYEEAEVKEETNGQMKKKVTLEGLILSGREALGADAGDLSDEMVEDEAGFHQYRPENVRAALAVTEIPDAALIHAVRKTRQQAREIGKDFIPVRQESVHAPGSRLVRDDGSDDEEERVMVRGLTLPSDKPDLSAGVPDVDADSEVEEWEEQQIKNALPAIADITGEDMNPFALAPPPPRLEDAPPHLKQIQADSVEQLLMALRRRLEELKIARSTTEMKRQEVEDRLFNAVRMKESRENKQKPLDTTYKRAQAIRGYFTDLIECLDEKMPEIESLESRSLALHRKRCEFLQERRRTDVIDQSEEVLNMGKNSSSEGRVRSAEREGRRRSRRLKRTNEHLDGDSTDEELPTHMQHSNKQEREDIRKQCSSLFADALPSFRSVRGVAHRVSRLRTSVPQLYNDAYIADFLPKLVAPFVRHQLILWNPLADEDNDDYEKMDWYKCLMMFGVKCDRVSSDSEDYSDDEEHPEVNERTTREDSDLFLVPTLVNRVVMPKLIEVVEVSWDPMSVRSCTRLRIELLKLLDLPRKQMSTLKELSATIERRLKAAVLADVYLPTLPPHVAEGVGNGFWRRCVGVCLRLLRGTLSLCAPPDALNADHIVMAIINTFCLSAGAAPAPLSAFACSSACTTLPKANAHLRRKAIHRLAMLAAHAQKNLQSDNPMHYKALDQVRVVIAEAKAAESNNH